LQNRQKNHQFLILPAAKNLLGRHYHRPNPFVLTDHQISSHLIFRNKIFHSYFHAQKLYVSLSRPPAFRKKLQKACAQHHFYDIRLLDSRHDGLPVLTNQIFSKPSMPCRRDQRWSRGQRPILLKTFGKLLK